MWRNDKFHGCYTDIQWWSYVQLVNEIQTLKNHQDFSTIKIKLLFFLTSISIYTRQQQQRKFNALWFKNNLYRSKITFQKKKAVTILSVHTHHMIYHRISCKNKQKTCSMHHHYHEYDISTKQWLFSYSNYHFKLARGVARNGQ